MLLKLYDSHGNISTSQCLTELMAQGNVPSMSLTKNIQTFRKSHHRTGQWSLADSQGGPPPSSPGKKLHRLMSEQRSGQKWTQLQHIRYH